MSLSVVRSCSTSPDFLIQLDKIMLRPSRARADWPQVSSFLSPSPFPALFLSGFLFLSFGSFANRPHAHLPFHCSRPASTPPPRLSSCPASRPVYCTHRVALSLFPISQLDESSRGKLGPYTLFLDCIRRKKKRNRGSEIASRPNTCCGPEGKKVYRFIISRSCKGTGTASVGRQRVIKRRRRIIKSTHAMPRNNR